MHADSESCRDAVIAAFRGIKPRWLGAGGIGWRARGVSGHRVSEKTLDVRYRTALHLPHEYGQVEVVFPGAVEPRYVLRGFIEAAATLGGEFFVDDRMILDAVVEPPPIERLLEQS